MNEEVKETIKILQNNSLVKSGSYEFIGDSDITYAEIYILLKFIEDLQQENQKYKEVINKAIEELKKGLHELDIRRREEVYIEQYIEEALNMLKEVE